MAEIGTVIESSIGPNRDQTSDVRLVKATLSSDEDVQTLQLIGGLDHAPVEGATVLVFDIGESWKLAIPVTDGTDPTAAAGEKYIYSQDSSGAISASLKLKNDGTIEINGNTDNAVRHAALNTAIELLKTQIGLNLDLIVAAISALGGTYVKVPLTAEISASRIDEIKVP